MGYLLNLLSDKLEQSPSEETEFVLRQADIINAFLLQCVDLPPEFIEQTVEKISRGRPALIITHDQLEFLLELKFSVPDMARLLCVSKSTVKRRLREFSLSVRQTYCVISDEDLRKHIEEFTLEFPNCGFRVASGFLQARGVR